MHVTCDNTCVYIGPRDVPLTSLVTGHSLERERDLSGLQSVRPCAWWCCWWERLAARGSKDGGADGGAVLRAVLWKSEQRQQCLRVSRQTHWQRAAGFRGLPERQGEGLSGPVGGRLIFVCSYFVFKVLPVNWGLNCPHWGCYHYRRCCLWL